LRFAGCLTSLILAAGLGSLGFGLLIISSSAACALRAHDGRLRPSGIGGGTSGPTARAPCKPITICAQPEPPRSLTCSSGSLKSSPVESSTCSSSTCARLCACLTGHVCVQTHTYLVVKDKRFRRVGEQTLRDPLGQYCGRVLLHTHSHSSFLRLGIGEIGNGFVEVQPVQELQPCGASVTRTGSEHGWQECEEDESSVRGAPGCSAEFSRDAAARIRSGGASLLPWRACAPASRRGGGRPHRARLGHPARGCRPDGTCLSAPARPRTRPGYVCFPSWLVEKFGFLVFPFYLLLKTIF
jgi:hypothetical protein